MDIGLPRRHPDPAEDVASPYAVWVKDSLEVAFDQVRRQSGQAVIFIHCQDVKKIPPRGAVVAYDTSDGRYSGGSNVRR